MKFCWAIAAVLCLTISAPAQTLVAAAFTAPDPGLGGLSSGLDNEIKFADQPAMSPRLSPELALAVYERRAEKQLTGVPSYAAATTITAELPQMNQRGAFELLRQFSAPHELHFKPVHFSGDSFVKSNVIVRLLQQDVEHAQKDDAASTAITAAHYKFIYRGNAQVNGADAYIFEVKPRAKAAGLFKGKIYVDASQGSLLRAEGRLVKSPSIFIKKIEFTADYADFDGVTLPVRIHSLTATRLVGEAIVDISTPKYHFAAEPPIVAAAASLPYESSPKP